MKYAEIFLHHHRLWWEWCTYRLVCFAVNLRILPRRHGRIAATELNANVVAVVLGGREPSASRSGELPCARRSPFEQ